MLPLHMSQGKVLARALVSPARGFRALQWCTAASSTGSCTTAAATAAPPSSSSSFSSSFSSSSSSSPALRCTVAPLGLLHSTRLLRRPQTIKPNPNEATSGQFDKSFEKMTETIEARHPFRQHHVQRGNLYDVNHGERTESQMKQEAEEDLQGREREKPAARQARSYFSGEDLSPEAMHVRSPHLKVAQNAQRQKYDKKILKTTTEPEEYYYPEQTQQERQKRNAKLALGWGAVGVATFVGLRKAGAYMRTAG